MKKKINWWVIAAIVIIGVPIGYVAMGIVNKKSPAKDKDPDTDPVSLFLNLKPNRIDFDSKGGEQVFEIDSNTKWKISMDENVDWLLLSDESGEGKGTVTVTVEENSEYSERATSIKVIWTDSDEEETKEVISVKQGKAEAEEEPEPFIPTPNPVPTSNYLTISSTHMVFAANGGSKTVTINSNTDWNISSTGGEDWLSISTASGIGNKTITLNVSTNNTTQQRLAKINVEWTDGDGRAQQKSLNITQGGAVPLPEPITLAEVQDIVSNARADNRVPNLCTIVVNNVTMKYQKFRSEVQNGTYSDVKVVGIDTDERTGNAKTVRVQAVKREPVRPLSKTEAQSIIVTGDTNARIPDQCEIVINGSSTTYGVFREKVKRGEYTNVRVSSLTTDNDGNANCIKVKATTVVLPTPITKAEVQRVIGNANDKIPRNCKVIINNGESVDYWNFCRAKNVGSYSDVIVNDITTDASGNATVIKVSATVKSAKEEYEEE